MKLDSIQTAVWAAALCVALLPMPGLAQSGSPIDSALPGGIGPGVHSPNSPFAPLPQRTDVLPWSVLTDVKTRTVKNRVFPVFPAPVLALNNTTQRIQGFMMPLEPGEKQKHFLISSVPLGCSFCTAGGPESMVEIKTKTPVKYTLESVVVEGRLSVMTDDEYGLYYRMVNAVSVK